MLIDTHAHLNSGDFKSDYKEAIKRALDKNVWLVNIGTDFEKSKRAVEIANEFKEGVFAAVGIHPTDFNGNFNKQDFLDLAKNEKVVAIGECGLDYYRTEDVEARKKQKDLFLKQIELASEVKKPLIIHCRDANEDLLKILKENKSKLKTSEAGIMHFFGGSGAWENVDKYLDLGFYISFSGVITFPKYDHYEDIARLPLDRILVETDSPFAAPVPFRGQRNEPAYVVEVAKKLAEILRMPLEEVCEITTENAKKIFGIS
ncbi:TatD family hydrolase [Candidatus Wolfebacteria bacterium]|nr:TatD family hydrolase [Candidatus Wolfebacteria bacterium]